MLQKSYKKEIFNPECRPGAMSVHCFAHLDQDVGEALPGLFFIIERLALRVRILYCKIKNVF
jgi:hypothetical protein